MKLLASLAMAALCAFAALSQTAPAADPQAKKWLTQQYGRMTAAILKGSLPEYEKVLRSLVTPDFQMIGTDGKSRDLKKVIQDSRLQFAMTKKVLRCTMKVVAIQAQGTVLLVTTDYNWLGKVAAPSDPKIHEMMVTGRTIDTWSKSGTTWQLKSAKAVSEKMMIDGKTFGG